MRAIQAVSAMLFIDADETTGIGLRLAKKKKRRR
jgi:hypothetical protein